MYRFSKREILMISAGLLLTVVLSVLGTFYVFPYYVVPGNPNDPLVQQGGLTPEQESKK
jgi:hypothetical protein